MRNPRHRAVTIAAALATLFPGAVPAAAQPAARQAEPVPWAMAPCATAHLSETELDPDGSWFVTFGGAVQCVPVVSGGGIRLATYPAGESTGTAPGYNVRLFPSADPGASRAFGAATMPRRATGEYGVCVLAGDDSRISCARVTISKDSSGVPRAATEPLDPDAPLVTKQVVAGTYTGTVHPPTRPGNPVGVCGTCF
ncbi:hypothetical protein AB0M36_08085 [Actinoplanes sp. NPDC051346]|uniref:hypothetical protein n=1 Tax=Actinoplanes sp. NPDC051346 TaxID=3155048 RepID=UPI00343D8A10